MEENATKLDWLEGENSVDNALRRLRERIIEEGKWNPNHMDMDIDIDGLDFALCEVRDLMSVALVSMVGDIGFGYEWEVKALIEGLRELNFGDSNFAINWPPQNRNLPLAPV